MARKEEFRVQGEDLVKKVRELIKEGNIRSITIKDRLGKTLAMFPMTVGVVGIVLAPVLAAVGAIAALVTECTITVEREDDDSIEPELFTRHKKKAKSL